MTRALMCLAGLILTLQNASAGSFAPIVKNCSEAEGRALQASKGGGILWFSAPWCPTCAAQGQAINSLVSDKALEIPVVICKIDYDTSFQLQRTFNVWSQSALVKVAGGQMIKKSIGATDTFAIKTFLER